MDGKLEPSKLTGKQRAFVNAYLGDAHLNATKAARLAGYKLPRQNGYENLTKPYIRAAIDAELEQRTMSKMEVLARISIEARRQGSFADILTVEEDGTVKFDWKKAEEHGAIECFASVDLDGPKIKLNNPLPALFFLAKAYGLDRQLGTKESPVYHNIEVEVRERAVKLLEEALTELENEPNTELTGR